MLEMQRLILRLLATGENPISEVGVRAEDNGFCSHQSQY